MIRGRPQQHGRPRSASPVRASADIGRAPENHHEIRCRVAGRRGEVSVGVAPTAKPWVGMANPGDLEVARRRLAELRC